MRVYVVMHCRDIDDHETIKMIGVYSSEETAQQAVAGLRSQPGFSDWPDAFSIGPYDVDRTYWAEGFSTT